MEIKFPVKLFHRIENHGGAELRIVHGRRLDPVRIHQLAALNLQPALLLRLPVQICPGVRRGEGNLNGLWVDIAGKLNRLLNRLRSLARKPKNERPVNLDPEIARIAGKFTRDIDAHALLNIDQYLIVP